MIKSTSIPFCFLIGLLALVSAKTILASTLDESPSNNTIILSNASLKMANIKITKLQFQTLPVIISAPGEVVPNANLTTKVTTRVSAQVIKRYVQEGEHIKAGQPLVMLSSVDMATTQSDLLLAFQEWERVKSLGQDAVSAKRYSEAQIAYQRAYSTALAYGMTEDEIKELIKTQKPHKANGDFQLLASRDGTIFNINFNEGELIEAGRILLQIVNESTVWVNAKLPPYVTREIKAGNEVQITLNNRTLNGQVIQVHHQLDEITRTRGIRIEIVNSEDLLHPGQFVNCIIKVGKTEPVLAVPSDSLVRTDDADQAVYIEKAPNEFQAAEVKVIETIDGQSIIAGIPAGTPIVTQGAFFIHSEFNKQGFGTEGH